jgi:hypothetical protein
MTEWVGLIVDCFLIVVVTFGIVQAMRLMKQLRDLRASRVDMDRFVRDFNGAVIRAEAGIKALRSAARESGDDLEKLVDKAVMVRDELNFIVESADSVAERLSVSASSVLHTDRSAPAPKVQGETRASENAPSAKPGVMPSEPPPTSRAEKELLQALQKMK